MTKSKDIIRLTWREEPDGEALDVETKDHYKTPALWENAFVLMARSIVGFFAREGADHEEIDFQAGLLLRKSAMSLRTDPFLIEAMGVGENARHPGEVSIPRDVWNSSYAKEVLSVWVVPSAEAEALGLPDPYYLSGETEAIPYTKMGDLLAHIALRYVFFSCKGDDNLRLKMLAQIQKDFMTRFDFGMTKQ